MIHAPVATSKLTAKRPPRRWLARIHTWFALVFGLYIVMLSVTGSAIVFRREANQWLVPRSVTVVGEKLSGDALRSAVVATYAEHTVLEVREPQRADRPVFVGLERGGERDDHYFDPYAATDLGSTYPDVLRALEWLVDLHDNLLVGPDGRVINGVGGAFVTVLIISGVIIWWPGRRRLGRSLIVGRPEASARFAREVHNALGIYACALLLVWALTAVYFGFPDLVERSIDYLDVDKTDNHRPGEAAVLGLIQLHFGRFGGLGIRVLWSVLGLLPAVLFVTGFVLWWVRIVRRRRRG